MVHHDPALTLNPQDYPNVLQVSDMHIEAILQMQNELVDQQKELKSIEGETMEQLRLLHQNISRLAKKFDSFEVVISNLNQQHNGFGLNGNQLLLQQQQLTASSLKSTKSSLNKLNNSIQQIKVRFMFLFL